MKLFHATGESRAPGTVEHRWKARARGEVHSLTPVWTDVWTVRLVRERKKEKEGTEVEVEGLEFL